MPRSNKNKDTARVQAAEEIMRDPRRSPHSQETFGMCLSALGLLPVDDLSCRARNAIRALIANGDAMKLVRPGHDFAESISYLRGAGSVTITEIVGWLRSCGKSIPGGNRSRGPRPCRHDEWSVVLDVPGEACVYWRCSYPPPPPGSLICVLDATFPVEHEDGEEWVVKSVTWYAQADFRCDCDLLVPEVTIARKPRS